MAHFKGTVTGNHFNNSEAGQFGTASRLGHKKTGLAVECNGWTSGITVEAYHNTGDKNAGVPEHDCFFIYRTGGSGSTSRELLATVAGDKIKLYEL